MDKHVLLCGELNYVGTCMDNNTQEKKMIKSNYKNREAPGSKITKMENQKLRNMNQDIERTEKWEIIKIKLQIRC